MIEPRPEFVDELEMKLRTRHQALQPRRLIPWRMVAAAVIVLVAASLLIPSVRSFAQGAVDNLFRRADSDTRPASYPQETNSTSFDWVEYTSIEDARAAATGDIRLPQEIPAGFTLQGVYVEQDGSAAQLDFGRPGRGLLISITTGEDRVNDNVIGESAEIVPVTINDIEGAYVEGVWGARNPGDDFTWMPNASFRRLRWVEGDVRYEIFSMGGSSDTPGYLTMEDMIALAESFE